MDKNKKLAGNLFALVVGMVMLAYASVPLYKLFCATTSYGGTTKRSALAPNQISNRVIRVEFNTDISPDLHWQFAPNEKFHDVRVGEQALTSFMAKNLENHAVSGRAVYNVVPFKAGAYFNKIQCFCFDKQTLAAGQKVDMPVSFFIDPSILSDPEMNDVTTITLSYSFFPLKE
jgi:cytochrome c oxidase assembly protein subunit 11